MTCPLCHTAMSARSHEGAPFHACTGCGGQFLSFDALRTVLADETRARSAAEHAAAMAGAGTAATAEPDTRPAIGCPTCTTPMRRIVHQYSSGVWIDSCADHGVWLDAEELTRLEAYAEAVRRNMVPPAGAPARTGGIGTTPPAVARMQESDYVTLPDASDFPDLVPDLIPNPLAVMTIVPEMIIDGIRGIGEYANYDHDAARREAAFAARMQQDFGGPSTSPAGD